MRNAHTAILLMSINMENIREIRDIGAVSASVNLEVLNLNFIKKSKGLLSEQLNHIENRAFLYEPQRKC